MWRIGLLATALAAPPTVELIDGEIVGRVSIPRPPEEVRAKVADPVWVATTEGGSTRVSVAGREGECLLLDAISSSALMTVRYATRQCPTSEGVEAALRTSDTFTDYRYTWRVVPEGAGALVEYRLRMRTKLSLPQSWIDGTVRRRVQGMLEKVGAALTP